MSIYKFRVVVDSEKHDVFRDILVDENENMETFFHFIMSSFNFRDDQMASFYKSNENWSKGLEISLMDMGIDSDSGDEPVIMMSDHKLTEFIDNDDDTPRLILVYDFMKMWIFLLEMVDEQEGTLSQPQLALSVGDAPNEDDKKMDENKQFDFEKPEGNEWDDEFSDDSGFNDEDLESFDDYNFDEY